MSIVFSNDAGSSEPLVLLLGELITTNKAIVPTLIDNTPQSLVTTSAVISSDTTNIYTDYGG